MNCTNCQKWTEEPSAHGRCRACYDYANCSYPVVKADLGFVSPQYHADVVSRLEADLSKANARVQELEEFIRPFAESCHDIECDVDHLACTCIVGPAQDLLDKGQP